jgi:signal transduction histidine kinase
MCAAQQSKLDSLLAVCNAYPYRDSLKVVRYIAVARQYNRMHKLNEAIQFGDSAYQLARKLPSPQPFANTCLYLAHLYHGHNQFSQALDYYNKAIAEEQKLNHINHIAALWLDIGALYLDVSDYPKSLEANMQAIHFYNETKDSAELNSVYLNMGQTYLEMGKPLDAIVYIRRATAIFKQGREPNHYGFSVAYDAMGNAIQMANAQELQQSGIKASDREKEALSNYYEGLRVAMLDPPEQNYMPGPIYKDIGLVYSQKNDPRALESFNKAADFISKFGTLQQLSDIEYNLGHYYAGSGAHGPALNHYRRGLLLAKQSASLITEHSILQGFSSYFEKAGKSDSALFYFKQSVLVQDSILSAEKQKDIARKQLQLDFALKENTYMLNEERNSNKLQQQLAQISYDRKIKWLMGAGILLAIAFAGYMMHNQRVTKKLNRIIVQQKSSLEQLVQVKNKLFSVVGHDLRGPVNSLVSFTEMLENKQLPPEKLAMYTASLRQQLTNTSSLMNNLLNWAASQMEGFKPANRVVDVRALLDEVCKSQEGPCAEKQMQLSINVEPGLTAFADADMTALILRNLVANAIKFSDPAGNIAIEGLHSNEGCAITIIDQGKGMHPEDIAIFNSPGFATIESTRGTAGEKGTGLGLLLCKTFAGQMGGHITAFAEKQGMRFLLVLPVAPLA